MVFSCLAMAASSIEVVRDLSAASKADYDFLILRDGEPNPSALDKDDRWSDLRVVDVEWVKQTLIFGDLVSRPSPRWSSGS